MTTYRERRAARAERLREWADKRQSAAAATFKAHEVYRGDHAFNFQPGHIPERARVIAREDRAFRSLDVADRMDARADEIERQADRAIYSDDPDAIDRLQEKLAHLEAERARLVAINAAIRRAVKGTTSHAERVPILAELARAGVMTPADLADLMSTARAFGTYFDRRPVAFSLDNIGGNITRTRQRLASLTAPKRLRLILARRDGICETCGQAITVGEVIGEVEPGTWAHRACAEGKERS